jgi:PAS domain S-box-containing protein
VVSTQNKLTTPDHTEDNRPNTSLLNTIIEHLKDEQIYQMLCELSTVQTVFNTLPFIILIVNSNRRVWRVNKSTAALIKRSEAEILGLRIGEALGCIHAEKQQCGLSTACISCPIKNSLEKCLTPGRNVEVNEGTLEFNIHGYHKKMHLNVTSMPLVINREHMALIFIEDITKQKKMERREKLDLEILKALNKDIVSSELMQHILSLIQKFSECESVALRIRDKNNNYPYYAHKGLPKSFIEAESQHANTKEITSLLETTDKSAIEPSSITSLLKECNTGPPFFTKGGSFWTNSTTELLKLLREKKTQNRILEHFNREGYESLALIPLKTEKETIGLLQLADTRHNRFTLNLIEHLEKLSKSIEVALTKIRSAQTLYRSERFLPQILNGFDEGVVIIDREYNILYANRGYLKQTGWELHDVLGEKCYQIAHHRNMPCTGDRHTCPVTETFKKGKRAEAIHRHFDKKNNSRWALVRSYPLRNENSEITCAIATITDITRQKYLRDKVKESEKRYHDLLENSLCAIAVHRNFQLLYINPAGAKLLGASSSEELIGKHLMELVHPDCKEIVKERVSRIEKEGVHAKPLEEKLVRIDGKTIDVEVTGIPITYKGKPAVQVIIHDISERKQREREIKAYTKRLERTNKELELYSHLLAHDLRNMLQVIEGYAEILAEKAPEHKELAEKIILPAKQSLQTIADLRELMKAETEKTSTIDLNQYITSATEEVASIFPESTFNLHLPKETLKVKGNKSLKRVIYNLLHNAAVHNKGKANVNLTLEKQNNTAVITIADDGRGIEEQLMPSIFQQGVRGTDSNGTGLGLYVVKQLTERFGGTIKAENSEEGGAVFTLHLPLSTPQ